MDLFFSWEDIANRPRGLTFDDVLLVPQFCGMRSRRDPNLSSPLTPSHSLKIPFISSNMDTITEAPMAIKMNQLGGFGIIHRFMTVQEQVEQVKKVRKAGVSFIGASIGVNPPDRDRGRALVDAGVQLLTIDIAHGHSRAMLEMVEKIKSQFPKVALIAGNVATPEGTQQLMESGVDAVKVGIGPGSMCTTRIITGCGVPQLTAVAICAQVGREKGIPIIADGGIRTSGDAIKALCAGANTVMLGSVLSGTTETPGKIQDGHKLYRGMASKSAQDSWRGGVPKGMASEGESVKVAVKGPVEDVIDRLSGGLRSGMTYLNAASIEELPTRARFVEMSPMGQTESRAHGLLP